MRQCEASSSVGVYQMGKLQLAICRWQLAIRNLQPATCHLRSATNAPDTVWQPLAIPGQDLGGWGMEMELEMGKGKGQHSWLGLRDGQLIDYTFAAWAALMLMLPRRQARGNRQAADHNDPRDIQYVYECNSRWCHRKNKRALNDYKINCLAHLDLERPQDRWTMTIFRGCHKRVQRKVGLPNTFLFGCHILVILVTSSLDYLSRENFAFYAKTLTACGWNVARLTKFGHSVLWLRLFILLGFVFFSWAWSTAVAVTLTMGRWSDGATSSWPKGAGWSTLW